MACSSKKSDNNDTSITPASKSSSSKGAFISSKSPNFTADKSITPAAPHVLAIESSRKRNLALIEEVKSELKKEIVTLGELSFAGDLKEIKTRQDFFERLKNTRNSKALNESGAFIISVFSNPVIRNNFVRRISPTKVEQLEFIPFLNSKVDLSHKMFLILYEAVLSKLFFSNSTIMPCFAFTKFLNKKGTDIALMEVNIKTSMYLDTYRWLIIGNVGSFKFKPPYTSDTVLEQLKQLGDDCFIYDSYLSKFYQANRLHKCIYFMSYLKLDKKEKIEIAILSKQEFQMDQISIMQNFDFNKLDSFRDIFPPLSKDGVALLSIIKKQKLKENSQAPHLRATSSSSPSSGNSTTTLKQLTAKQPNDSKFDHNKKENTLTAIAPVNDHAAVVPVDDRSAIVPAKAPSSFFSKAPGTPSDEVIRLQQTNSELHNRVKHLRERYASIQVEIIELKNYLNLPLAKKVDLVSIADTKTHDPKSSEVENLTALKIKLIAEIKALNSACQIASKEKIDLEAEKERIELEKLEKGSDLAPVSTTHQP